MPGTRYYAAPPISAFLDTLLLISTLAFSLFGAVVSDVVGKGRRAAAQIRWGRAAALWRCTDFYIGILLLLDAVGGGVSGFGLFGCYRFRQSFQVGCQRPRSGVVRIV